MSIRSGTVTVYVVPGTVVNTCDSLPPLLSCNPKAPLCFQAAAMDVIVPGSATQGVSSPVSNPPLSNMIGNATWVAVAVGLGTGVAVRVAVAGGVVAVALLVAVGPGVAVAV